ncbi:MAG: YggT family protein [Clostridium sp.]
MILEAINGIFRIIELAIIVECIGSWIPQLRYNQLMDIVHSITNPILEPCRRLQDRFLGSMPIDFSPILAFAILDVIREMLMRLLYW